MANDQQPPSSFLLLVIIGAVIFFASRGGSTPDPAKPQPDRPDQVEVPVEKLKPTPDQCWEALAKCVENKWVGGTGQQHTDHVVKIADGLKVSGSIPDASRVDQWRAKRVEITDANRSEIAAKLRGK